MRCSPKQKNKVFTKIETVFLSKLRCSPKQSGHLDTDCSVAFQKQTERRGKGVWMGMLKILWGQKQKHIKLPKKYKIAQNFDAKLPKICKMAQNFEAKLPKKFKIARNFTQIFDTLNQAGGPVPPYLLRYC